MSYATRGFWLVKFIYKFITQKKKKDVASLKHKLLSEPRTYYSEFHSVGCNENKN